MQSQSDINMEVADDTCRRARVWTCSAKSDRGKVRQNNEDAFIVRDDIGVWAVADGMGGHRIGDVASRMIIDALAPATAETRLSALVEDIERRLLQANSDIIQYARTLFAQNASMGSTLVSLILKGQVGACLWVGDSRLYRWRNHSLTQLSRDHSQVQELVDNGLLEPAAARQHPQAHVITRAIGAELECQIDLNVFNAQANDVFLLCSDGLSNTVSSDEIERLLPAGSAEDAAAALMEAALAHGAPDNVTLIVIKSAFGPPSDTGDDH